MASNKAAAANGAIRSGLLKEFSRTTRGPVYVRGPARWLAPTASSLRGVRGPSSLHCVLIIIKCLGRFVKREACVLTVIGGCDKVKHKSLSYVGADTIRLAAGPFRFEILSAEEESPIIQRKCRDGI